MDNSSSFSEKFKEEEMYLSKVGCNKDANENVELRVGYTDAADPIQMVDPSAEIEMENRPRQFPFIPETNNKSENGATEDKD